MKFPVAFFLLGLSPTALAAPNSLFKRAALLETPSTGYAVSSNSTAIVILSQSLNSTRADTATVVKVASDKTILGAGPGVTLTNVGLSIKGVKNVIVRNLAIKKVIDGDAVAVQKATNVWLDHLDLSSDMDHDKDYYDGLLDLTHAADNITVSYVKLHDHWKASLIGHSDNNKDEDWGHLRVTFHNCYWSNINSRGPSLRFGTVHIFNSYYENVSDGINVRLGAQALVQNNVWVGGKKPLYAVDNDGFAVAEGNDFGSKKDTAPVGTLTRAPYVVPQMVAAKDVKAAVVGKAGNTLSF